MNRSEVVARRFVAEMFSGPRAGNVEVHLRREEIAEIVASMYRIGYSDGIAARTAAEKREDKRNRHGEEA